MQAHDARVFNNDPALIRTNTYKGDDQSWLSRAEIGRAEPVDHGVKAMLVKFSRYTLSRYTPAQRKLLVEQAKFEALLPPEMLNQYLSERYTEEDLYEAWKITNKRTKKKPKETNRRKKISISVKQRRVTPEQRKAAAAKANKTKEENKSIENYLSYDMLKREFMRKQKLLSDRIEPKMKDAVAVYANRIISQGIILRTAELQAENNRLKEYLRINNLPLPDTEEAKIRRQKLREAND